MGIVNRSVIATAGALPLMISGAGLASAQESTVTTATISQGSSHHQDWNDDYYCSDGLLGGLLDILFGDYYDDYGHSNHYRHGDYYRDDDYCGGGLLG
ncbi:MAG: hypothetical protein HOV67_13070 [Kribbellaceae bacterium]|nr:hypothetical protein [Catenulispora sp.]NUR96177.1 hypothetical protein [Kribbellaceae bacterium]